MMSLEILKSLRELRLFPSTLSNHFLSPSFPFSVYFAERQNVLNQDWHKTCVKCETCGKKLEPGNFADNNGKIYCKPCYNAITGLQGYGYGAAGGALASFQSYGQGESQLIGGDAVSPDQQGMPPPQQQAPASSPVISFCSECGTKLTPGSKFCSSCGSRVA